MGPWISHVYVSRNMNQILLQKAPVNITKERAHREDYKLFKITVFCVRLSVLKIVFEYDFAYSQTK